ncbi:hypothetical protein HBI56_178200 [Parastagonospora nodorum]|uniref:Uncharacterized protein n=2 Tax=Phaeosphaeria nodorum (strain SN15 / ATCC MYA-4574 / FGSC 10173) TaxID=321614 RepID=A0A7U2ET14_PHANO|nr:hypothetical protein SNOG_08380 [Parastagonospora nodorum SN15]KAH3917954.1 hypothetical protein HBH56_047100 [Parastagonospora nodorum]EAT84656.1 hypothetical protein SNOG_08380 [Parastagonospora nodorum SN15]KAH3933063.1 hypothetical protein HBH54_074840 [Parastagonospora nodorum]KAH3946460.1 hypothetical protein HBH53_133980 [Parastagonospora nodorum]KAH3973295.1 hypothetical protein HBH52_146890 [Parastagonospora nodorum]
MSSKDAHLYGAKPKNRSKAKDISSSSSLAFSSTLSNLIKLSATDTNKTTAGRARPQKEDIFKTHNKNVKKRALKDLEDSDFTQKHRTRTADEKGEDEAAWKRTKRRMEEKARLYDALKRGDVEDRDDKYGVDFDRKWAEKQEKGEPDAASSSESEASEEEEQVEYVDEFGRTRKGTRAEAAREERRKRNLAADEPDRFTARPSMPDNIIYGDAVQSNAFNPDETISQAMADLAAKRDKELTPPPELHFDGRAEARQRGTGFMYFSKDEEERQEQIRNLEKERQETDRVRKERKEQIEKRKEMIREKKRAIQEKRSKGQAEKFLDDLGAELLKDGDEAEGSKAGEVGVEESKGEA